jgi:hypothetical protein
MYKCDYNERVLVIQEQSLPPSINSVGNFVGPVSPQLAVT